MIVLFSCLLGVTPPSPGSAAEKPSPFAAEGEQWKYVTSNDKGERFYYDPASMTFPRKDVVSGWVKIISGDATVTKALEEVNCSYKIIRDARTIVVKPHGPQQMKNSPSEWRAVERDTPSTDLYKIFCKGSRSFR